MFLIPATGGEPRRLTWHPGADVVQGWTADGEILLQSGRDGRPTRVQRFFTVGVDGGLPEPLAVPQAYHGEMSADGAWLAFQEIGFWDPEWRNYRGGQAQPVSVVSTSNWENRPIACSSSMGDRVGVGWKISSSRRHHRSTGSRCQTG